MCGQDRWIGVLAAGMICFSAEVGCRACGHAVCGEPACDLHDRAVIKLATTNLCMVCCPAACTGPGLSGWMKMGMLEQSCLAAPQQATSRCRLTSLLLRLISSTPALHQLHGRNQDALSGTGRGVGRAEDEVHVRCSSSQLVRPSLKLPVCKRSYSIL